MNDYALIGIRYFEGSWVKFAKTSLESFGLAEGSLFDAASSFGDMATSMGLPDAAAAKGTTRRQD
jgi:hypothetical protein